MIWNLINTIIALGALIVALLIFWRTVKKDKSQKRELQRIRQKASLNHNYEKNPSPTVSRLHIINEGMSKARNITIHIDDKPIKEWEFCVSEDCNFTEIPAGNEVTVCVIAVAEMKARWEINITWDDDSGEPGHHEGYFEVF